MTVEVGSASYSFDVTFEKGVSGLQKIDKQVNNTNKGLSTLDRQTKKTGTSLDSVGRNAGQAGIQIQQLVGQIQGGQDAMLALSAQAADLGIVLGAPLIGSIVGIAAAFGGALIPSLSTGSDELERLIEKLDELEDKSGISVNQTKLLIQEKQKEAKAIGESTAAVAEQIITLQRQLDLMQSAGTGLDAGQFAIPRSAEQNQARYAEAIVETQAELVELRAVLDDNNASLMSVNNEITDLQTGNAKASEELDKLISRLEYETNIIGLTERGIALYTAELLGANEAQKAQINAKYDLIEAQQLELEGQREAAKQLRIEAREREALANRVQSIGLTRLQRIQQNYQDELTILQQAREQGIQLEVSYAEREKQIARDKNEAIRRYNEQQAQSNMLLSQSTQNTLGALGNAFGNFAQIAQQGGKESFDNYKKLAIAQATISTFMAANNALATPAPFPVPQILAGSIAALGLANVATIKGQQYSGARQFGGGVSQGSNYRVGENNMPELYRSANGQLGMIPGENGRVIPMDGMMGGQTKVEIYNYSGAQVKQSQSDDGRITRVVIGEIARQISTGNGPVPKAMRANTSVDFQGNR